MKVQWRIRVRLHLGTDRLERLADLDVCTLLGKSIIIAPWHRPYTGELEVPTRSQVAERLIRLFLRQPFERNREATYS